MSYNANIPLGTDPMIKSQSQLKTNFQAINRVFSENHVTFPTSSVNSGFAGMHNMLNFRVQNNPTTSATQIALFTKLVSGQPQLFFAPSNSQPPIQITFLSLSTGLQSTNPDIYLPDQYTFIPGPFILYGGRISGAVDGQIKTLTPTSTLLFASVQTINIGAKNPISLVTAIAGSSFTIGLSPTTPTQDIYYFAIGKP